MADRARAGEFSDFSSRYAMPKMQLITELRNIKSGVYWNNKQMRDRVTEVVTAVMNGDFDDTREEAEAWAASPEGQAMIREVSGK